MDSEELREEIKELNLKDDPVSTAQFQREDQSAEDNIGFQITSFSEVLNDVTFHFQIIRFPKQVFEFHFSILMQITGCG